MKTFDRGNGATLEVIPTIGTTGTVIVTRKLRGNKLEGTMVLTAEEIAWLAETLPALIKK